MTPWQYMTVSWMEPLIQKGVTRQMHDEDVWDLGWEFQHARLHEAFRKLQGSVTRRIFVANGMDLVRTTSLNMIRLAASECPNNPNNEITAESHSATDTCTSPTRIGLYERSKVSE